MDMERKSSLIKQILEFGMADLYNQTESKAPEYVVAAGDPVCAPTENTKLIKLPEDVIGGKRQLVIDGYSMSAQGIDDGDNLLAVPFDYKCDEINEGDFLIVKVDPTYYEKEPPLYDLKLRRAIMVVDDNDTEDTIIAKLQDMDSQPHIWMGRFQKCLRRKFAKARKHYPHDRLVLSTTYKNGVLQYSFHKLENIQFKAIELIKRDSPHKLIDISVAA